MPGSQSQFQVDKQQVLRQQFQMIRVLGQGSFGKVYLIRNKQTRKQYALKRYNRYQLQKKSKSKMLIRSICILQCLDHPGIIKFINYIISPDQNTLYLLFECCKKGSMEKLMSAIQKDPLLIKYVLYKLGQVLLYLKEKHVAHRDIKPSNITFNSEGELKLIDFDQAVCFDKNLANNIQPNMLIDFGINPNDVMMMFNSQKNRASKIVGTQLYMPPEMILSAIGDQKGDLWAYTCILYEFYAHGYMHIEFDSIQNFQEELAIRATIMKQHSDPLTYNFFNFMAKYSPKDRPDIEKALAHDFFAQVRKPTIMEQCRVKLSKSLKANFGVHKMTQLDLCEIQMLGLKIGREKFQQLKTVVFVRLNGNYYMYEMIGGPQYFKLKSIDNSQDKIYIHYDSLQQWRLVGNQIQIKAIKIRAFKHKNINNTLYLKHLYPHMLQSLFDTINNILLE